jgi:tRNA threonylcarbamoyladenosine biosynthesis protein TsaB
MSGGGALLLGFDTCGASGSVALARAGSPGSPGSPELDVLGERELAGRSYSAQLVSAIGELLAEAGAGPADLGAIMVTQGPGSFTGVRVGLSTAKGLAEAVGVPVIAVSRLAVLAEMSGEANVLAVLDAGRGEFYAGEYRAGVGARERLCGAGELDDEVRCAAGGLRVVVCEERVAERLAGLGPLRVTPPGAMDALRLGLRRFRGGDFDDSATLDGNYLRRSDAELFARRPPAALAC